MTSALDLLRDTVGPAPREVTDDLRQALARPDPPHWMNLRKDGMRLLWEEHEALLRHGEATLGFVYMANADLFEEGHDDAPASMLHTFDPFVLRNPELLESIGASLYQRYENLGGHAPYGPWFEAVHHAAADGYARTFGLLLPPTITWGHVIYLSTPMIHRDHLPRGQLDAQLLPVLAARDPHLTGATLILPSELWPQTMRADD